MLLTYKYRLITPRRTRRRLEALVEDQRLLYNAALEEQIGYYRKTGKPISKYDQQKSLTQCRKEIPEMRALPVKLQRGTLKRLDEAFDGFFRRVEKREKAGFPRFRGRGWYDTLEWEEFNGITFDGRRIRSTAFKENPKNRKDTGSIRVRVHRKLKGKIKTVKITRDGGGWYVCFTAEVETGAAPEQAACRPVGVDAGLNSLATLSTGEKIPNARVAKKAEKELRRRQRHLSRCKKGSNGRRRARERVARLHRKVRKIRNTYLHQVSADMVKRHDLIAVEDLNTKGMMKSAKGSAEKPGKNVRAKAGLNKSIADASWGILFNMMKYKAERAGIHFVKVNPKNTTQGCSGCGNLPAKKLELKDREYRCDKCGLVMDRDENAAINVLNRGVTVPGAVNVADCGERSPGNILVEQGL